MRTTGELRSHAPERIVDAVWGKGYSARYSLVVRVVANDRSGLLRDITTILANEKVNVLGVASRSDTKQQLATIDMTIEIYNLQVLGRVLGKLNQVRMLSTRVGCAGIRPKFCSYLQCG